MKPILLSGIKPTARVHIGNYFGAMKQFVDLQDKYQNFNFIADYHALNQMTDNPQEIKQLTLELTAAYLAVGLDPKKTVLFRQSDVPQVTELNWIFNSLITPSYLQSAHAYKDAAAKKKDVNMGLFCYPVLMAADILIYGSDLVPVGKDQEQHLEIAVDLARKFNHTYSQEVFKLPKALIWEGQSVRGIDGEKMSKSKGNVIELFESEESIKKKVMSIKTDSKGVEDKKDPEADNVFAYHKLFSTQMINELRSRYENGGIGYKESKEILLANMMAYLKPMRDKYFKLIKNEKYLNKVLANGAKKAEGLAEEKMKQVRKTIGVR
ncbi:MAG: tryptophan--tRNA ligase [Patescibacteria group bacterium]